MPSSEIRIGDLLDCRRGTVAVGDRVAVTLPSSPAQKDDYVAHIETTPRDEYGAKKFIAARGVVTEICGREGVRCVVRVTD